MKDTRIFDAPDWATDLFPAQPINWRGFDSPIVGRHYDKIADNP